MALGMNRTPKLTEQAERFKQTARELGVDLDEEKLKEALRKMSPNDDCPGRERAPRKHDDPS